MSSVFQHWSPVTYDFGLIRSPLETVVTELRRWHGGLGTEYARSEITRDLSSAFESLLPLTHAKPRRLFIATRSDWTACFQNGIQGSDPSPAMGVLCDRLQVESMRVCSTVGNVPFPANIWELFAPESRGGIPPLLYRRSLAASNDGGRWVFHDNGERFPFEDAQRYAAPRKRERFTREMFANYLRHFGIDAFSDDFFVVNASTPAVRLQQTTRLHAQREFTLEQVKAGDPWKRS